MKTQLAILVSVLALVGCATNPNKAEVLDTKMEKSESFTPTESLGVKDGNLVVQKKVEMNEQLRKIQNEVYSLEDRVYGNRKYGSQGLYGALKACRVKVTSKEMGGNGKLMFTEPVERITDKEEAFQVGLDEKDKIIGVSEEFLHDRITRFNGYKKILQTREDEYQEKLEICDTDLASREHEMKKNKTGTANSMAVPVIIETPTTDTNNNTTTE